MGREQLDNKEGFSTRGERTKKRENLLGGDSFKASSGAWKICDRKSLRQKAVSMKIRICDWGGRKVCKNKGKD